MLKHDEKDVMAGYDNWSASEIIRSIESALNSLPPECRASARFEIKHRAGSKELPDYPSLVMEFTRPETPEEIMLRLDEQTRYQELSELKDECEYQRLSEKFSDMWLLAPKITKESLATS